MLSVRYVKCYVLDMLSDKRFALNQSLTISLWKDYRKLTYLRIEAAYVKCIKMFFSYDRLFSVRQN